MAQERANSGRVEEQWPSHIQERTAPGDRERGPYEVTEDKTFEQLEHTLMNRMQAQHVKFVTDKQHKGNGRPYARHSDPPDPGVIVFWEMDGTQHAMACDAYTKVRDNARAILLCLQDKLRVQNRPAATGSAEFEGYRALPPGGDATPQAPPQRSQQDMTRQEAADLLGVSPDAEREIIKMAYRTKMKDAHPDRSGDSKGAAKLNRAKEVLLDG